MGKSFFLVFKFNKKQTTKKTKNPTFDFEKIMFFHLEFGGSRLGQNDPIWKVLFWIGSGILRMNFSDASCFDGRRYNLFLILIFSKIINIIIYIRILFNFL